MDSYFTDNETLALLRLVHTTEMQDKFNSNKKKHRKVWDEIAQILEMQGIKKSATKCQNRFENTKRSYNNIKRNHIGSDKPSYPYWDFWESILGEKTEMPWLGFEKFHETYLTMKQSLQPDDPLPDWEHWQKYEDYYNQKDKIAEKKHIHKDGPKKSSLPTSFFTDRETDELLLIMGEPATRQIFIKHRKKHRIAWNYIIKRLRKQRIHKTADKVKNRFENLKRKYMHYKKNLKVSSTTPNWRYWNVFEEYMATRPNPADSDFMTDEKQAVDYDGCVETDADDVNEDENDCERTKNSFDKAIIRAGDFKDIRLTTDPINVDELTMCRICLQSEPKVSMTSIYDQLNSNIRINEALAMCVGLELFQEPILTQPNKICFDCIQQLLATYNFRKLCWASDYVLKSNSGNVRVLQPRSAGSAENQEGSKKLNNFTCKDCSLIFDSESSHQQHLCEHHNNDLHQETDNIPNFVTKYEFVDASLNENIEIQNLKSEVELLDPEEITESHPEKLASFKCPMCMKKFPNIAYIKNHLVQIHSLQSDSEIFKNYLELSNCDSDDELDENVKCYICGKNYVKREYLKKHLKLIHNVTDADYNVYQRIDEENKTKKPLLCYTCGESFVLKHIFKKHIEHHERGSLLSCDHCGIRLVDKTALQRHMILHTGQRSYKCIFCAKGFFTRISQKRHERNVHKEKCHQCQYCEKKFAMWKFLERHLNTHTAEIVYECDQCDKKYLNKNHLKVHKFRHAKEPPFKCLICSKGFFDRSILKKHNYVHTGNPYQCTNCDRTFDRRDKMNNHLQKVHAIAKSTHI